MTILRFWTRRNLLFWLVKASGIFYSTPNNLSYWWNFGFLSLFFLILQIVTGIVLAMFYNPSIELAYASIMAINNEVYYGWWLRGLHSNGASFFFAIVYVHMFRGLYYGSFAYPRQLLWVSGMVLWLLMVATAFLGYILPWGQMSFWGAMVITSLFASIPFIGNDIILLLWGGYSIEDATLHRFYSLHFALPFVILIVSIIHLFFLHEYGSNNPLGISNPLDHSPFSPYYVLKDVLGILFILFFFFFILFFSPDLLGHFDNYERANFLVTPAHIVPEWYFLPLYAILRSVTNKLLGIFLLFCFIFVLFILPFYLKMFIIRSSAFKPVSAFFFWVFFFNCLLLGWIGSLPVMEPYLDIGLGLTISYFFILLVLFPIANFFDRFIYDVYLYSDLKKNNKDDSKYYYDIEFTTSKISSKKKF
jgi:quinol-cytochrome oxidoreductase complex cytochrome b subunit